MSRADDSLHGEESIIQEYLAPLAAGYPGAFGLTDDCAAFTPAPGHDLVVKTDPVAAGVHFFPDDPPGQIGWKALAVNVSDLAAKGAIPRAYLMALSFPEAPKRDWMRDFAAGLGAAQTAFGMHLIGGDTDRRPGPLTISITVLGEVPTGRMVRRGTAQPGDLIYVSGTLGDASLGRRLRENPTLAVTWGVKPNDAADAVRRYHCPEPRLGLRRALLNHARGAMDLSDGLAKDLGRMAKTSGCSAVVEVADVPRSAAGIAAVQADRSLWQAIIAEGDDYEVLAAVPPAAAMAFENTAAADGVPVTCIGRMGAGTGVVLIGTDGSPMALARAGWDHF